MTSLLRRIKAGFISSLPFLLLVAGALVPVHLPSAETNQIRLIPIRSTCIDLAGYDPATSNLVVHFTGRPTDRLYRYSAVSPQTWSELERRNRAGGVGEYFNNTIVKRPKKHPFEMITNAPSLRNAKNPGAK